MGALAQSGLINACASQAGPHSWRRLGQRRFKLDDAGCRECANPHPIAKDDTSSRVPAMGDPDRSLGGNKPLIALERGNRGWTIMTGSGAASDGDRTAESHHALHGTTAPSAARFLAVRGTVEAFTRGGRGPSAAG